MGAGFSQGGWGEGEFFGCNGELFWMRRNGRSRDSSRGAGSGVDDGCELKCVRWEGSRHGV